MATVLQSKNLTKNLEGKTACVSTSKFIKGSVSGGDDRLSGFSSPRALLIFPSLIIFSCSEFWLNAHQSGRVLIDVFHYPVPLGLIAFYR